MAESSSTSNTYGTPAMPPASPEGRLALNTYNPTSGRGLPSWKPQSELAALAGLRGHDDLSAMTMRDLLTQVEGQTRARNALVFLRGQAAEAFEQQGHVVGGDPESRVAHGDESLAIRGADAAPDLATPGGVLDRVVDQVADDRPDPRPVRHHHGRHAVGGQRKVVAVGHGLELADLLQRQLTQIERFQVQLDAIVFKPRHFQHLLHEQVDLRQPALQQTSDLRDALGWDGAVLEHRVVTADQCQRTSELMGGEVQELCLGVLELDYALGVSVNPLVLVSPMGASGG